MDLRKARKEKGLTQEELAGKLGISQNFLSDIENGKRKLSPQIKEEILKLGLNINGSSSDTISVPFINVSASAGLGIANFEDYPQEHFMNISLSLLGLDYVNAQNCCIVKVVGNSMAPKITSGDFIFVQKLSNIPIYFEGCCLVNYAGELYVKNIQIDHGSLVMKSINTEYKDIIIPSIEDTDVHLQIVGRVIVVIKQI